MTSSEIVRFQRANGEVAGLGDIDGGDLITPRFQIDHDKGVWVNTLTKMEYPEFDAILLGRQKQRIMWQPKLVENSTPRCRSNNFRLGFPNVNPKSKPIDMFPWDESVFSPQDYPPQPEHNGLPVLPCDQCNFKNWPDDDDRPACREQWTFALLAYLATPAAPEGEWVSALATVHGKGLSSIRNYISEFVLRRQPLFTQMTHISLRAEMFSKKTYYVPVFASRGSTDSNQWDDYYAQCEQFINYLVQDPRNAAVSGDDDEQQNVAAPTSAPVAEIPAQPQPEQQVYEAEVVEEPAQPVAPAAAAPAAPAPAQPAAPAAAAPAPAAPAPAAPAAAAPAAPAAAAPAAAGAAQPAVVAPGKLPF